MDEDDDIVLNTPQWRVLGLIFTLMCLILADIARQRPADSHTWRTLLIQYAIITLLKTFGRKYRSTLIEATTKCTEKQENILQSIIESNSMTEYGQKHAFHDIKSKVDFRRKCPLTSYPDIEHYIDRIGNGESNVLTKDPVVFLSLSSGTTGKSKVLPVTPLLKGPAGRRMGALMYYMMHRKAGLSLKRALVVSYMPKVNHSPCGLVRAPISYHMSRYIPFCTAPPEVFQISDEQAALYVHAVFGLKEREVGHMESLMATLMYSFWKIIAARWHQICYDIETGSITLDINTGADIMAKINDNLKPDPLRAAELRQAFNKGLHGIAKRVWPDLAFVRMLTTGGFAHYAKILRDSYMAGVPQLSQTHAASEGFLGVNMSFDTYDCSYMAMPLFGFLEFIPEDKIHEEQPDTLFIADLEIGSSYEMVMTTMMGLYRYRMGDVVKITHYINQCPVYDFQYRTGQLLNLFWEKTPEHVFYDSLMETINTLKVKLIDYTTTEDVCLMDIDDNRRRGKDITKCYVLFLEVEKDEQPVKLSESDRILFDQTLCSKLELYEALREKESIATMKVFQVKTGTFTNLRANLIEHTQNQQIKMPRVLRKKEYLRYLFDQKLL